MDATTAVCYAAATFHVHDFQKFPLLVVQGGYGTGKSTTLEALEHLCYAPYLTNARRISNAEMRDKMAQHPTLIVEEADEIDEGLLLSRYALRAGTESVKRLTPKGGWTSQDLNLYGAIGLHRRAPFKDPAVTSRAIVIETVPKEKVDPLPAMWTLLPKLQPMTPISGNRTEETWEPVIQAGTQLGYKEWIPYAHSKRAKAVLASTGGRDTEPMQAVYLCLLSCVLSKDRVIEELPLSVLRQHLKEEGEHFNSHQIGLMVRDMGFLTERRGGRITIHTGGEDNLRKIGLLLKVDDKWVLA